MSVPTDADQSPATRPGQDGPGLAAQLRAVNDEVVAVVSSCSAQQWQRRTAEEGWSLAAAGMHIAVSHLVITGWVHRLVAGLPMTETHDDFAVVNAHDAARYAPYEPARVVDRLRLHGAAAERFLEELTDPELDAVGHLPGLGVQWPVRAVIQNVLLGHPRTHLAGIRAGRGEAGSGG